MKGGSGASNPSNRGFHAALTMKLVGIIVLLVGGFCAILWYGGTLTAASLAVIVGLLSGIAVSIPIGALLLFFLSGGSRSRPARLQNPSRPARSVQKRGTKGKVSTGQVLNCHEDGSYRFSASISTFLTSDEPSDSVTDFGTAPPANPSLPLPAQSTALVLSESLPYFPEAKRMNKNPRKRPYLASPSSGTSQPMEAHYLLVSKGVAKGTFKGEPPHSWVESWPLEVPYQPAVRRSVPDKLTSRPSTGQPKSRQFRILSQAHNSQPDKEQNGIESVDF